MREIAVGQQFKQGDLVRLCNIEEVSASDFCLDDHEYDLLIEHEEKGTIFVIESDACDGRFFDIAAVNDASAAYGAISDYHFRFCGTLMKKEIT